MTAKTTFLALLACFSFHVASIGAELNSLQKEWLAKAHRFDRKGWIYLHVEGDGSARGFQHGYLLAKETAELILVHRKVWEYNSGMSWSWLVGRAAKLMTP